MSPLEVAVTMYHREHDRWNQWALFFFGSVVSVFLLWGNLKPVIPLWVPAMAASVLSVCWVMVALNIRASTYSWRAVAKVLEASPQSLATPFALYEQKASEFSRLHDLWMTLSRWRTESFLSVTRILTILGVLSAVLFLLLAVLSVFGLLQVPEPKAPS